MAGDPLRSVVSVDAMTPMQQGILLHHLDKPADADYVVQISGEVDGLDPVRWQAAWRSAIAAHPMLRTAIAWKSQLRPIQATFADAEMAWPCLDWRALDPAAQALAFEGLLYQDRAQIFDLAKAPLMRGVLIQLGGGRSRFLWTYHHIILDAWSSSLILGEVGARYAAPTRPAAAAPAFKAYVDHLARRDLSRAELYWTGCAPAPISFLPWPRAPRTTTTTRLIDPATTARLTDFCRRHRVTLATLVHSAWGMVHARWTAGHAVTVGVTLSDRPGDIPNVEAMVGPAILTIPAPFGLAPNMRVMDHLAAQQMQAVAAREHAHPPLSRIATWLGAESGARLFDTLIVFENLPGELSVIDGDAPFRNLRSEWATHYPLTIMAAPGKQLALQMRGAFEAAVVEGLVDALAAAAAALVQNPRRTLGEILELLPGPASAPILSGRVRQGYLEVTAPELILQACDRWPTRTAIVTASGPTTYAELADRIRRIASGLTASGVRPGDRVAICLARNTSLPAALAAVHAAGAAFVGLDTGLSDTRFAELARQAGATWRLSDDRDGDASGLRSLALTDLLASSPGEPARVAGGMTAYLVFTSGSTGRPGCVRVSHAALANLLQALAEMPGLRLDDRVLATTSLGFDIAMAELLAPLCVGATVLLHDRSVAHDPQAAAAFIEATRPTVIQATPTLWELLLAHGWTGSPDVRAWSGGEPLAACLARTLRTCAAEVWNVYGPTETTVWSTAAHLTDDDEPPAVGAPLANTRIILLAESGRRTPDGAVGEICIGGVGLADGYEGDAERTAERFVTWSEGGERLYRTGDSGRVRADGALVCLGRRDRQLKIRGVRIEPGEIEAVLSEQPGVAAAAVIAVTAPADGRRELAAFVRPRPGEPVPPPAGLRAALQARLASPLVPSRIVVLEDWPVTVSGKVDYQRLTAIALAAQPVVESPLSEGAPLLGLLLQILRHVLDRPDLGPTDDFLAFGGDSLLAVRVAARINRACGLDLRPTIILERGSAAALAAAIAELAAGGAARLAIEPAPADAAAPVTDSQRQLLFLGADPANLPPYHLAAAVDTGRRLDAAALQRTIDGLVRRHAILRTRFRQSGGAWFQDVAPHFCVALQELHLQAEEDLEATARRVAGESALRPFDRATGPLLRLSLLRRPARSDGVLLTIDHVIADAWSIRLIFHKLLEGYRGEAAGEPTEDEIPAVQFRDYAHSRALAPPKDDSADAAYWRTKLATLSLGGIPIDRPRPSPPSFEAGNIRLSLGAKDANQIRALARRCSVSLFTLILSAFRISLLRTMGETSAGIGTMLAGRDQPELEAMLGPLARLVVLHTPVAADMSLIEIAERERDTLVEAWRHRAFEFERIAADYRRFHPGDTATPLVQAMLVAYPRAMPGPVTQLGVGVLNVEPRFVEFDLVVRCYEVEDALDFCFSYNLALFEQATIARMARCFQRLIALAARYPDLPVGRLPLGDDNPAGLLEAFSNSADVQA